MSCVCCVALQKAVTDTSVNNAHSVSNNTAGNSDGMVRSCHRLLVLSGWCIVCFVYVSSFKTEQVGKIVDFEIFMDLQTGQFEMFTKQTIKDTALKLWKLFCCVFPDDYAKSQVCVVMVGKERIW